jgi:hypothetical protein
MADWQATNTWSWNNGPPWGVTPEGSLLLYSQPDDNHAHQLLAAVESGRSPTTLAATAQLMACVLLYNPPRCQNLQQCASGKAGGDMRKHNRFSITYNFLHVFVGDDYEAQSRLELTCAGSKPPENQIGISTSGLFSIHEPSPNSPQGQLSSVSYFVEQPVSRT